MNDRSEIQKLVGRSVKGIYMSHEFLKFSTDRGDLAFSVYGDCCSQSYFYDFIGVRRLLDNGPIVAAETLNLGDPDDEDSRAGEVVIAYGFRFVTEDPTFGEVSSVMSFRNDSNGYYGGEMFAVDSCPTDLAELTDDCLGLLR